MSKCRLRNETDQCQHPVDRTFIMKPREDAQQVPVLLSVSYKTKVSWILTKLSFAGHTGCGAVAAAAVAAVVVVAAAVAAAAAAAGSEASWESKTMHLLG